MREAKAIGTGINKSEKQMIKKNVPSLKTVTILGSLPPLRALSSYCLAFSSAVSRMIKTEFISFKHIYPSFLYPGGDLREDYTFPGLKATLSLNVRRNLTWYNPLTWIVEGLATKGQILHAQWWSPPLVIIYLIICLLYKIRNKPIVITVHNVIPHERKKLYDLCSRILFKLGDHFIVHSKSNYFQLTKHFGIKGDRVTQIPHGPLEFHHKEHITRDSARNMLNLEPKDQVVLIFGTIRPYKGIDIALEAFARALEDIPEARLVIAGKLWESWDRYEKIIKEKNISEYLVKHLHYIDADEVAGYFLASDLVILPYLHFDSQSGAGATALAFGKPMIVSGTGGLPELVVDQNNVVTPGDAEALADRIVNCLKNRSILDQMARDSRAIAEDMSWERIAEQTIAIYKKLLNKIKQTEEL